ncbi:MAG: DUF4364 family protein [Lachnospiraceae bacterium]|nr:DUF4364 family protein [Lachnospiraceae bacterium]
MLDKFDYPITKTTIYELVLEKEYSNYWTLTNAINELTEDGFIETSSTHSSTFVSLTDTGRESLSFFRNRISEGIRSDIDRYCEDNSRDIANALSITTNYFRSATGGYVAELSARDRSEDLIKISINMPTEESAVTACERWREKSSEIYSHILENLL